MHRGSTWMLLYPSAHGFALDRAKANYLLNVLRLKAADSVLIFNGRDGEWRAEIAVEGRKAADLVCVEQTRPQTPPPDLIYAFAPLKHARLDYMVQKAVEMGAGVLQPIRTRRTQSTRINLDRMRANSIEAAEQCGILTLPEFARNRILASFIKGLEADRLLVFCDEEAPVSNPLVALKDSAVKDGNRGRGCIVIVGPEGGFTAEERALVPPTKNVFAYRWDPASFAPTPPPSQPSHWCRRSGRLDRMKSRAGRMGPD